MALESVETFEITFDRNFKIKYERSTTLVGFELFEKKQFSSVFVLSRCLIFKIVFMFFSQGLCCIDEFDKLGHQQQALLEAMEQQSVSMAKAGVVCTLPARTSVIAAANPIGGHYNRGKTVSENLK